MEELNNRPQKRLSELQEATRFKVTYNPNDECVYVDYGDSKEEFYGLSGFFSGLSSYYKNMIAETDSIKGRIALCNEFLWHLSEYYDYFRLSISELKKEETYQELEENSTKDIDSDKIPFELKYKNIRQSVEKEVKYHKSYYEQKKEQYSELNSSESTKKTKGLTPKQKIIVLEYCGLLKGFEEKVSSLNKRAIVLAAIFDIHPDNVEKALSRNFMIVPKGDDVKTYNNMQTVIDFFNDSGMIELAKIVEKDLKESKKR